ncbi:hypothetical protein [Ruegeria arenilitoris]|uniref:hypothetical protein n=1 Tax=Ruegeria arenilitoris TaxID=1173585 RepID=UPI00346402D7
MCGVPLRDGRKSPRSAVVDHKQPAEIRPDLFLDDENTWSVCFDCHQRECRRIEDRARSMNLWNPRGAVWIAQEKAKVPFICLDGRIAGSASK